MSEFNALAMRALAERPQYIQLIIEAAQRGSRRIFIEMKSLESANAASDELRQLGFHVRVIDYSCAPTSKIASIGVCW
jgi:precorrin-6B methylase 2